VKIKCRWWLREYWLMLCPFFNMLNKTCLLPILLKHSVVRIWMGWTFQEVPCWFPLHVVAFHSGSSFPLQVSPPTLFSISLWLLSPLFSSLICFSFESSRALHEVEIRRKGGLTRLQFFLVVLVSSFAYYIVPGFLFQSITALSFVC